MNKDIFTIPVTVYWENTDMGGIVYHSQFLNFAERARSEWIKHQTGKKQTELMDEYGIGFVVKLAELDFLTPAFLDDELTVSCDVVKYGKTSFDIEQDIWRQSDGKKIVQIKIKAVSIDKSGKPVILPKDLLEK